MFGLNLINPSIAINLVRKQLEKQLKKDVPVFDLRYDDAKETLHFIIDNEKYLLDSDKLKSAIQFQVADTLKKNQSLDYVILKINKEQITAFIYYTEDNQKLFVEQKIN